MRQGKKLVFTKPWKEGYCRSGNHSILLLSLQQNNLYSGKKKWIAENGLELETSSLLTAI